jgi:hypothetical protein
MGARPRSSSKYGHILVSCLVQLLLQYYKYVHYVFSVIEAPSSLSSLIETSPF